MKCNYSSSSFGNSSEDAIEKKETKRCDIDKFSGNESDGALYDGSAALDDESLTVTGNAMHIPLNQQQKQACSPIIIYDINTIYQYKEFSEAKMRENTIIDRSTDDDASADAFCDGSACCNSKENSFPSPEKPDRRECCVVPKILPEKEISDGPDLYFNKYNRSMTPSEYLFDDADSAEDPKCCEVRKDLSERRNSDAPDVDRYKYHRSMNSSEYLFDSESVDETSIVHIDALTHDVSKHTHADPEGEDFDESMAECHLDTNTESLHKIKQLSHGMLLFMSPTTDQLDSHANLVMGVDGSQQTEKAIKNQTNSNETEALEESDLCSNAKPQRLSKDSDVLEAGQASCVDMLETICTIKEERHFSCDTNSIAGVSDECISSDKRSNHSSDEIPLDFEQSIRLITGTPIDIDSKFALATAQNDTSGVPEYCMSSDKQFNNSGDEFSCPVNFEQSIPLITETHIDKDCKFALATEQKNVPHSPTMLQSTPLDLTRRTLISNAEADLQKEILQLRKQIERLEIYSMSMRSKKNRSSASKTLTVDKLPTNLPAADNFKPKFCRKENIRTLEGCETKSTLRSDYPHEDDLGLDRSNGSTESNAVTNLVTEKPSNLTALQSALVNCHSEVRIKHFDGGAHRIDAKGLGNSAHSSKGLINSTHSSKGLGNISAHSSKGLGNSAHSAKGLGNSTNSFDRSLRFSECSSSRDGLDINSIDDSTVLIGADLVGSTDSFDASSVGLSPMQKPKLSKGSFVT